MIRILNFEDAGALVARKAMRLAEAERVVAPIIADVRARGDAAVLEYARTFDGFEGASVRIPVEGALAPEFERAVAVAAANIREYARWQLPDQKFVACGDGRRLGQIVRPLDSMGAYIPAGRYPLPSTLLMTVIPAQVAGVATTCVACPNPSPEILGIAAWLGVTHLFRMGGAQAIAALAFGTGTVPRVDRIVGPGNIYVAAAKKLIAGEVGIDFIAGPTEIVIIAAEGNPVWLAADMLAQAEHDVDASAILLTTSRPLAEAVAGEIERQLATLPTAGVARISVENNGAIVIVDTLERAVEFSNALAPEHVSLHDPSLLRGITHAGSLFLGQSSPEAAGDYVSGPNHVLPTSGAARLRGGLSAADFVKVISVQELTHDGLAKLTPAITTLARAEGLEAHARSVEVRNGRAGSPVCSRKLEPREAVLKMAPYSPPSGGRAGKLRLDFNENTVGCSPRVVELLRDRLTASQLSIYPEYLEAIEELAAFYGVATDEITVTNGTDEAIQLVVNTYVASGDEVVLLKPSYAMYRFYAELAGASIREVCYRMEDLAFPLEELLAVLTPNTRAVLMANPNNPTGTGAGLDGLRRILEAAPGAAVLIDEAYFEFSGTTALDWIREYPNLFVSRTFSKVHGMAAMRCGCLFSCAANVRWLRKAHSPYSVNTLAAIAARAAIQDRQYVADYVTEVLAARELACEGLGKLGIRFFPSQANFVLFHAGDRALPLRDALRERGVLVRDRSYEIPGCVRLTIGTRAQILRFLEELESLWTQ